MKKRLIVTLGDSGGVGPEVALKAVIAYQTEARAISAAEPHFILCGPKHHWQFHANSLAKTQPKLAVPLADLISQAQNLPIETTQAEPQIGKINPEHGRIAYECIAEGVRQIQAGNAHSLVTAPLSKEALKLAGLSVPGQTEILSELSGAKQTTMAFHSPGLIVALATTHIPLREVCNTLSAPLIELRLKHLAAFCQALGLCAPKIGVCGVNPHASEGGMFGDEEERLIKPGMRAFQQSQLDDAALTPSATKTNSAGANAPAKLFGPLPGDTAFFEARAGLYDAVLAMYPDQGLASVKTVAFDSAVNVTLGMPFYRTSPDHGTAFALAGRGVARHESMLCALKLAERLIP